MMYVAHSAFRRDLARLLDAAYREDTADGRVLRTGWEVLSRHVSAYYTAADTVLWPAMYTRLMGCPRDLDMLEAMAAKAARLDPLVERIDDALASGERGRLPEYAEELCRVLMAVLAHEEAEALPLARIVLTPHDWAAFGAEQRRHLGARGLATYVPWLLDGASEWTRHHVLAALPPPMRMACRALWAPLYRRRPPWERIGA